MKTSFVDRKFLLLLAFFLFFLYALLVVQFFRIQIVEGDKWCREADVQHEYYAEEPFVRGKFYSNTSLLQNHIEQKQSFVTEVDQYHLYVDPDSIPKEYKDFVASSLAQFFSMKGQQKEKIFQNLHKRSRSRKCVMWLDLHQKQEIEKWWFDFAKKRKIPKNAVFFIKDFKRTYPFGPLLGQVLHAVQLEKDPLLRDNIPIGGLELYFNSLLKGKMGKRLMVRSPFHPIDEGKVVEKPIHGADIHLTINHYLQAIAEEELKKGVENAHAKAGWAVMMDPFTGEILALAHYPFFDLAHYNDYFNKKELEEVTRAKAVTDAYEPGSIFKPITVSLCLQANEELKKKNQKPLFYPDEKIDTSNGHFPGRKTPLSDGRCHHFLNMYMGLQKSSNVYMGKITQRLISRMGEKWYRDHLVSIFGFGKKTGIELPAETQGIVPTIGKVHPNGKLEWSLSTPYSMAIGHNVLVNSMQMIRAYAIIANGGYEVKPTLIRKIVKEEDQEEKCLYSLEEELAQKNKKQVLDSHICQTVLRGLKFVTKSGGTSIRGDILGYSEGGKSGTSEKIINGQYSHEKYISSFIGIAPINHPRFVLLITVEEPKPGYIPGVGKNHHGGVCASPIFREIATRSLQYMGIAPDDPYGYAYGDPRRDTTKADWMKEVADLKKTYETWNGR
jgi:cell division protein FtsI (penicillin-binding protein 3)